MKTTYLRVEGWKGNKLVHSFQAYDIREAMGLMQKIEAAGLIAALKEEQN